MKGTRSTRFVRAHKRAITALFIGLAVIPAVAQVPSALIREGDLLGPPGDTISGINNSARNHAGGYAFTLTTTGSATLSNVWGAAGGGAGALIRTEGTFGVYQQTSFESFFGFSNAGNVSYSPSSTSGGTTGLDGVWLDSTPILVEEQPVPSLPGMFSSFNSRPGVTAGGSPYWIGGFTDTQGGSTQNRALFFGPGATVMLIGGGSVGGVPELIKTGASNIDFDFRFSSAGTNYITPVLVDSGSTTDDGVLVMNGNAMMAGGSIMREASPIPAGIGGLPGENWDNFDFTGVTESGDWFITGDTAGATATDEFIVVNGSIIRREGDALAGEILSGSIEGAFINEDGDLAFIWDIQANTLEALFFNDMLLLKEGDPVDWDGDGIVDPGTAITNFTGTSSMTLSDRDGSNLASLYFTADVDIGGGTILEGAFQMTVPEPGSALLLALGAILLLRRR